MQEEIINDILATKKKCLKSLLRLTKSPIEEMFLASLLKFLEKSISDNSEMYGIPISAYSYIFEDNPYSNVSFGEIAGLSIMFSTHIRKLNTPDHINVDNKLIPITPIKTKKTKNPWQEKILESKNQYSINQHVNVFPQYKVDTGNKVFYLDFAFLLYEFIDDELILTKKVAIECDGYEYHSGKEQFSKDRERQRILSYANWTVIQFSGSQIFKNSTSRESNFEKEINGILNTLGLG